MISLITPTGDRPESFALLVRWVNRFWKPTEVLEWVVVDDGVVPTDTSDATVPVVHIRPSRMAGPSVARNYLAGLRAASGDVLVYLEDDEWYHRDYLAVVVSTFLSEPVDMVGIAPWRAWYLRERRYRDPPLQGILSATTSRTSVRRGPALDCHVEILKAERADKAGETRLWGTGYLSRNVQERPYLCVSLKDVPGRPKPERYNEEVGQVPDPDAMKLIQWIGAEDTNAYMDLMVKI